jgi:hypothetical protein
MNGLKKSDSIDARYFFDKRRAVSGGPSERPERDAMDERYELTGPSSVLMALLMTVDVPYADALPGMH